MSPVSAAVLTALLLAAAWSDVRRLRIPNLLVLAGFASAGVLALGSGGAAALVPALTGAVLGLMCLLPFFLLRMMGAGDIKLMAMVGAFVGPGGVIAAVLATMLAGGGVASWVWWRAKKTAVGATAQPVDLKAMRVPYAVAILIGTVTALAVGRI